MDRQSQSAQRLHVSVLCGSEVHATSSLFDVERIASGKGYRASWKETALSGDQEVVEAKIADQV